MRHRHHRSPHRWLLHRVYTVMSLLGIHWTESPSLPPLLPAHQRLIPSTPTRPSSAPPSAPSPQTCSSCCAWCSCCAAWQTVSCSEGGRVAGVRACRMAWKASGVIYYAFHWNVAARPCASPCSYSRPTCRHPVLTRTPSHQRRHGHQRFLQRTAVGALRPRHASARAPRRGQRAPRAAPLPVATQRHQRAATAVSLARRRAVEGTGAPVASGRPAGARFGDFGGWSGSWRA
jgi:hypothetical protein